MKKKQKANFLDYIPKHNLLFSYIENKSGNIEIIRENKGFFHRITQLLCGKPKESQIELDVFGSFIWKQIDGEKDVYRIGKLVEGQFGEKAEPLYERLTEFVYILRKNNFIIYTNFQK